jgi:hypothetical protein
MHKFLSVYYFALLLLHVSATVCHPQRAALYLLSDMLIWILVDKILCIMLYVVYSHIIYTQQHTTQNFINQIPKFACHSEGTNELPEDGMYLPKYVGAAKLKNKIKSDTFFAYF